MADTPNLKLPYILAAQSQKHLPHNEAIRALDAVVQLSVLDRNLAVPPASPAEGDRYIVDSSPSGAWAGQAGRIAAFQDGAWMFYVPKEGWISWVADENVAVAYDGAAWALLSSGGGGGVTDHGLLTGLADDDHVQYHNNARGDARYTPLNPVTFGINATADTTNRFAVGSVASLFNHTGTGGHQIKLNKASAADTASFLFQNAFSGRAEIGLTGDDDFHFKVSPNGTAFNEAIIINRTTGACSFPNTSFGGVADGDKGDVVVASSGSVWTVDANAVSNAKLADVSTATLKGRVTAGTGDPEDLTVAQAKTLLNLAGTNSGDQNVFTTIAVAGQSNVVADAASDTLTLVAGTNVTITTDAATETITINAAGGGGGVTDGDKGDITVSGTGTVWTIDDNAVTNAKAADMATATLKGRTTAGTGDPEDLTAAQVKTLLAISAGDVSGLGALATLSSVTNAQITDLTVSTADIADNAVSNAKLAVVATATFKGRTTAGTGDPEDLTAAQATALLANFVGDAGSGGTKGLVPAPVTGDAGKFLKGDGTWGTPGGGSGIADGDYGDVIVSGSGTVINLDHPNVNFAKFITARRKFPLLFSDFLHTNAVQGDAYLMTAISSGTFTTAPAVGVAEPNHPGVVLCRSSTSANSGVSINVAANLIRIGGGEQFDAIIRTPAAFTNTTWRIGFIDTANSSDCVDGCYFEIPSTGAAVGKTSAASVRTTSATVFTILASTWYHFRVVINAAGTQADFFIYSDAGTQLGTQSITTNLPVGVAANMTGAGVVFTNSGTTATDLANIDFMAFAVPGRTLQRGALT